MIEYINSQLNLWYEWQRSGHTRLGYPRRAAFMAALVGGGSPPINDDHAMQVERAVHALPAEQKAVVQLYYVQMRCATAEAIAKELHVSRDTVYARLHRAHVNILDSLQEQEIAREAPWRAQLAPGKKWVA